MAITTRDNLIIPEILQEAVKGAFEGVTALWGTGAARVADTLPGTVKGGDEITVPYFGALGELDDVAGDGDALVPAQLTMSEEKATVQHSGKAFEITNWAQMAAFGDPYAEAARQMKEAVIRRADKALIDKAAGTSLVKDVYDASSPKTLDWDTLVDAKLLWGDEQDEIVLMGVHSKVYGDLLKLKDGNGRPLLVDPGDGKLARFAGIPVAASDRLPVLSAYGGDGTPDAYTSVIVIREALAFWFTGTPSVKTDSDILVDSTVAAIHVYWVAHLYSRMPGLTKPGAVKIITN